MMIERFPTFGLGRDMIIIENDANLGALGEGLHGAAKGCRNYLYLKLSSGIGMGMVLDGRLYRGTDGAAGEAGHVTVSPMADRLIKTTIARPQQQCPRCGKLDCLENLASSRAIVSQLQATNSQYAADLTIQDVIERAKGDVASHQLCLQALVDAGIRIGYTLTDTIRLLAPERVILGGFLADAKEILLPQIEAAIEGSKGMLPVEVSAVSSERIARSEVQGAVALALRTASAVSSTTSEATTTTSEATAAGFSRRSFLGLIHAQRQTPHLEAVRLLDGVLRFAGGHIDERESAGPSGFPIVDEFDGFDFTVALEYRSHFVFCCGEWQVANIDRRHSTGLTDRVSTPDAGAGCSALSLYPAAVH